MDLACFLSHSSQLMLGFICILANNSPTYHKYQSKLILILSIHYSSGAAYTPNTQNPLLSESLFSQAHFPAVLLTHWVGSMQIWVYQRNPWLPAVKNWLCMTAGIQFRSVSFKPNWSLIVSFENTDFLQGMLMKRFILPVKGVLTNHSLKKNIGTNADQPDTSIWWQFQLLHQNKSKGGKHQDSVTGSMSSWHSDTSSRLSPGKEDGIWFTAPMGRGRETH